ncbi:WD40 repeat-like protein [Eremomyces bilateralis CBS 781.70]|uniref:WD40 repeat-like protein n=1 Tax=Eremomyces bilateralis CBS 781.70 TaxID=1392243 RepID=A0A6G1GAY4_9PEZI|nr:WD40 repeat-like protein [Eremomyces bilateralis CBS 781.70]KAF1815071.1 WD40 repeat-like protein [Eremomyces bilateralis CBS 781.70]
MLEKDESPAILVARFLRTNGYNETLTAFLQEAGLPVDAGITTKGSLTIENLIREKNLYDVTRNFEKSGLDEKEHGWKTPAPSKSIVLSLPSSSNVLCSSTGMVEFENGHRRSVIISSTADRRLTITSVVDGTSTTLISRTDVSDSPILSYQLLRDRYIICGTMSGSLFVYDFVKSEVLSTRKDHAKYVVNLATIESRSRIWLATAGWDSKVFIYSLDSTDSEIRNLENAVGTLTLPSNPESITFVNHPDTNEPILVLGRRDSTFLYFYRLPLDQSGPPIELKQAGRQNLAPHSNAWVAFTPCSISVSPVEPLTVAVATSSIPHMKLIIVRLLLPKLQDTGGLSQSESDPDAPLTAAAMGRAELARQSREDVAMLVHVSTFALQTQYSTPSLTWRPDGTGVWLNGDDGIVRGVEASTGRVKVSLEGHEPGSKIRCVFAGYLEDVQGSKRECLLSGGFDQRLILWEIA